MASRESVIDAKTQIPRVRALQRERIDSLLARIREVRATLVVAPAGSGKTTALAQFAMVTDAITIWLRTDPLDGSVERFVAHLDHGWARALDLEVAGWLTIDDAIHGFEAVDGRPIVVVIDDLHEIRGRPAEAAVARLIVDVPDHIGLAIGTRTMPSFDVTRLRLTGELLEIGPDDLRFRTWEAERLLNEMCGLRLSPEDVARLTQRIEGWAAGLQLFHLAVRHKPPSEQRRLIGVASSRSSLARQYLTRNVLDALPDNLRGFLLDTSVLGVVNGALADKLLARDGSDAELWQLEELEQFVMPLNDGTYRYHEVLRSHLETELGNLVGTTALTERFALAAPLLEEAGYESEALRCHARAGQWDDVSRLAGSATAEPFARSFEWLDLLPSSVAEDDPWLVLARARASLAAGKFRAAIEYYQRAGRGCSATAPTVTRAGASGSTSKASSIHSPLSLRAGSATFAAASAATRSGPPSVSTGSTSPRAQSRPASSISPVAMSTRPAAASTGPCITIARRAGPSPRPVWEERCATSHATV